VPIISKRDQLTLDNFFWYEFQVTNETLARAFNWMQFSFSATRLKRYYSLKFNSRNTTGCRAKGKPTPKYVFPAEGKGFMTPLQYANVQDGQMWVNNYGRDTFFQVNAADYFDACLLQKDTEGKNATFTLQTVGGIDDSKTVSESSQGEIYFDYKTK
jgi:hypothetical protein